MLALAARNGPNIRLINLLQEFQNRRTWEGRHSLCFLHLSFLSWITPRYLIELEGAIVLTLKDGG